MILLLLLFIFAYYFHAVLLCVCFGLLLNWNWIWNTLNTVESGQSMHSFIHVAFIHNITKLFMKTTPPNIKHILLMFWFWIWSCWNVQGARFAYEWDFNLFDCCLNSQINIFIITLYMIYPPSVCFEIMI